MTDMCIVDLHSTTMEANVVNHVSCHYHLNGSASYSQRQYGKDTI